jgi:poly-gamma-glutamate synthesis protein (capsule biosynthesis protein)
MSKKINHLKISLVIVCILILSTLLFFKETSEKNKVNDFSLEESTDAEFINFINQKKKLSQTNEEVSLFNKKEYYFWNEETNSYQKELKGIESIEIKDNDEINNTEKIKITDLNSNGINELYQLKEGVLKISEDEELIWQSPDEWWVDNFVLADINSDGEVNINLSLWKVGSFGSSKPFWLEKNDMSIKNHFFVLRLEDNQVSQVWGSSNLSDPNCEFIIADINSDGQNELLVTEGYYQEDLNCKGQYLAIWSWNGWGFSNEWRSDKSNYSQLRIEKINGKSYIIVNTD